jgi:hypothetical protein
MKQEIKRFLTEQMGECWHGLKQVKNSCGCHPVYWCECGYRTYSEYNIKKHAEEENYTFLTWEGFANFGNGRQDRIGGRSLKIAYFTTPNIAQTSGGI